MNYYSLKKILVAVDLSETSLNALNTAIALAKKHHALLYILSVKEAIFDFAEGGTHDVLNSFSNNADDVLNALSSSILFKNKVKNKILHASGHTSAEIVKTSLELQCDLIVMGTHGASGFRDFSIGTNTYTVFKYAQCPVLAVPPQKEWTRFDQVLFPIRPISGALARYDVVCHFMNPKGVLHIVGVSNRKSDIHKSVLECIVEEVQGQLEADHVEANIFLGEGLAIADDVLLAASKINPDLIVITSALDVTTKPYFIGQHAQKVICLSRVPILSVKKVGVFSIA